MESYRDANTGMKSQRSFWWDLMYMLLCSIMCSMTLEELVALSRNNISVFHIFICLTSP